MTVTFNASNSTDLDGDIISYDWYFDDGDTDSGSDVNHVFTSSGDYAVTLTVTEKDGGEFTTAKTMLARFPQL